MFQKLIHTNKYDTAVYVLRLALGAVIFPHGAQKMLGWFGGYGFSATMQGMSSSMELPGFMVFLVIMIEFVGAIALIFGFLGRLMAFGIGVVMAGAMFIAHWANGFL